MLIDHVSIGSLDHHREKRILTFPIVFRAIQALASQKCKPASPAPNIITGFGCIALSMGAKIIILVQWARLSFTSSVPLKILSSLPINTNTNNSVAG